MPFMVANEKPSSINSASWRAISPNTMLPVPLSLRDQFRRYVPYLGFIALYLLFDWASYIEPLYGLNITPWNPDPALGLVFWLRYGRRAALPWFIALVIGEYLVRGLPAGWLLTIALSILLTLGYGLIGEVLRRSFNGGNIFNSRSRLFAWLTIVVLGLILNDVVYITILYLAQLIPGGQWSLAVMRFGIGELVGVVVSMPLIWMFENAHGRSCLKALISRRETAAYIAMTVFVLWMVFGLTPSQEFKHFYYLFLPIIWASARQGMYAAGFVAFIMQIGIISIVRWADIPDIPVFELQMLGAALALVGFFIGIVVDEQRKIADELKHTLRLAAAGEMTAALAHELNQPMTALSAYGKACEYLLARGETGPALENAIHKMINESRRASEVVRRLRDFFLTGALQLQPIKFREIVATGIEQFSRQFEEHGIVLTSTSVPDVSLNADRLQTELVLRNLLANAFDAVMALPAGQRRIWLTAEVRTGRKLCLSVEDSGPGVSSAIAARLFEPFVSSKSNGLGLGLVLSRGIVEAHGGSLWAEIDDHGVFRFVLPLLD